MANDFDNILNCFTRTKPWWADERYREIIIWILMKLQQFHTIAYAHTHTLLSVACFCLCFHIYSSHLDWKQWTIWKSSEQYLQLQRNYAQSRERKQQWARIFNSNTCVYRHWCMLANRLHCMVVQIFFGACFQVKRRNFKRINLFSHSCYIFFTFYLCRNVRGIRDLT